MNRLRFHPSARDELLAAARFYSEETPGLGRAFVAEVRASLDRVIAFPESGAPGPRNIRHAYLDRFPFTPIYRVSGDVVEVIAAAHQRRRPGYWQER